LKSPPVESWIHRLGLAAGFASLVVIGVAAIVLLLWPFGRGDGFDATAIQLCRAEYHQAQNRIDSARVDASTPITSRGQATTAVSCATLKAAGRLR
jgi:hypothetical protein